MPDQVALEGYLRGRMKKNKTHYFMFQALFCLCCVLLFPTFATAQVGGCSDSWTTEFLSDLLFDVEAPDTCTTAACIFQQMEDPEGCLEVCAPGGATFTPGPNELCEELEGQLVRVECGSYRVSDIMICQFCTYTNSAGTASNEECSIQEAGSPQKLR